MKFSTREDVEAPLDATFEMLCDFDGFERQALRRGAEVQRVDDLIHPGVGMTWEATFEMRGRSRDLDLTISEFDRPNGMVMTFSSGGLEGVYTADCVALSKSRTRVSLAVELKPQNLSARLLLQSFKLAKGTLDKKFKLRVAEYAKQMEERYKASV